MIAVFESKQTQWRKACILYFKALNRLQIIVFDCYIQRDYVTNNFYHERKIHKARVKLLTAMKKIRSAAGTTKQELIAKLENVYEIIFSLNTLKCRVTDHATFEMCENELKKISHGLTSALEHIILFLREPHNKSDRLLDDTAKLIGNTSNQIDALEELYRSTLQVVSKDPIFFLFFVQDLIALRDELESFILGCLND